MVGVARRMLRRQDLAEEAVQDAFMRVWRAAGTFDPQKGAARSWLYAILRNCALSILRDEGRFTSDEDAAEEAAPMTESALARLPETSALRRCLERLDPAAALGGGAGLCAWALARRAGRQARRAARHGEELGAAQPDLVAGVHGMTDRPRRQDAGRRICARPARRRRQARRRAAACVGRRRSRARSKPGGCALPRSTTPPSRSPPATSSGAGSRPACRPRHRAQRAEPIGLDAVLEQPRGAARDRARRLARGAAARGRPRLCDPRRARSSR